MEGWFDSSSDGSDKETKTQTTSIQLPIDLCIMSTKWIVKQSMALGEEVIIQKCSDNVINNYHHPEDIIITETHFAVELDENIVDSLKDSSNEIKELLLSLSNPNITLWIKKCCYGSATEFPQCLSTLTGSCLCSVEARDVNLKTTKQYAIPSVILRNKCCSTKSLCETTAIPSVLRQTTDINTITSNNEITYKVKFSTSRTDDLQQSERLIKSIIKNAASKVIYYDVHPSDQDPNYWKATAISVFAMYPDTALYYDEGQKRVSICGISGFEVLKLLKQNDNYSDRIPFAISIPSSALSPTLSELISQRTGALVCPTDMYEVTKTYKNIPPVVSWMISHTNRCGRRLFFNKGRFNIAGGTHSDQLVDLRDVFKNTTVGETYLLLRNNSVVSLDKESGEGKNKNSVLQQSWSRLRSKELGRVVSVSTDGGRATIQFKDKLIIFTDVTVLKRVIPEQNNTSNWIGIFGNPSQRKQAIIEIEKLHRQVTEVIRVPTAHQQILSELLQSVKKPKSITHVDCINEGILVKGNAIILEDIKRFVSEAVHRFEQTCQQRTWNQYLQNDLLRRYQHSVINISLSDSHIRNNIQTLSGGINTASDFSNRVYPFVKKNKSIKLSVDAGQLQLKSLSLCTEVVDYLSKVMENIVKIWTPPTDFKVDLASCITGLHVGSTIFGKIPSPGDVVCLCNVLPESKIDQPPHSQLRVGSCTVLSTDKWCSLVQSREGEWIFPHVLLQIIGSQKDFGKIDSNDDENNTEPKNSIWTAKVSKLEIPTQEYNGFAASCTEWLSHSLLFDKFAVNRPTFVKATVLVEKSSVIEIHSLPVNYATTGLKTAKDAPAKSPANAIRSAIESIVFVRWCYLVDNCLLTLMVRLALQSENLLCMQRALNTTFRTVNDISNISSTAMETITKVNNKDLQLLLTSQLEDTKSLWTVSCEAARYSLKKHIDEGQHKFSLEKYESLKTMSGSAMISKIETETGVLIRDSDPICNLSIPKRDVLKKKNKECTAETSSSKRQQLSEFDDTEEGYSTLGYLGDPEPDFRLPPELREVEIIRDEPTTTTSSDHSTTCNQETDTLLTIQKQSKHSYRKQSQMTGDRVSISIAKRRLQSVLSASESNCQTASIMLSDTVAAEFRKNNEMMRLLLMNDIPGLLHCTLKDNILNVTGSLDSICDVVKATTGETLKRDQQQSDNEIQPNQCDLRSYFNKTDELSKGILICDCGRWLVPLRSNYEIVRCPDCGEGRCPKCGEEHYFTNCELETTPTPENNIFIPKSGYSICRHCSKVIETSGWMCSSCINSCYCFDCYNGKCVADPSHVLQQISLHNSDNNSWKLPSFLCAKGHRLTRTPTSKEFKCSLCDSTQPDSPIGLCCRKCDKQFCPTCKPIISPLVPQHLLPKLPSITSVQQTAYSNTDSQDVDHFSINEEDFTLADLLHLNTIST